MFRRADAVLVVDESGMDVSRPVPLPAALANRPDPAGAPDALLRPAPGFRTAVRGYDRMQVDNYVAWAEAEIATARRGTDDPMSPNGPPPRPRGTSRRRP